MALGKQRGEQANTQKRITKRLAGFSFIRHSLLFISQLFCFAFRFIAAVRVFKYSQWVFKNEMTNACGS